MVSQPKQKDILVYCFHSTGGDKDETIELYSQFDAQGVAPRQSNVTPLDSYTYALIMWHTGEKLGWFKE